MRFAVLLASLTFSACCNDHYVSGLTVRVEDVQGRSLCDAQVEASEGSYRETLDDALDDCVFRGAGERAGSYTLRVSKSGFRTAEVTVRVERDLCHVKNENVTVRLAPL
jgi:hypothetical protein